MISTSPSSEACGLVSVPNLNRTDDLFPCISPGVWICLCVVVVGSGAVWAPIWL